MLSAMSRIHKDYILTENGKIPWDISSKDLNYIKGLAECDIVIMGENTWESIEYEPIPNKINIIVSDRLNIDYDISNTFICPSLNDALLLSKSLYNYTPLRNKNVFVIDGYNLYNRGEDISDEEE